MWNENHVPAARKTSALRRARLLAGCLGSGLLLASTVEAQRPPEPPEPPGPSAGQHLERLEAERMRARAAETLRQLLEFAREGQGRDLGGPGPSALQQELARARAQLERAAREVAMWSALVTGTAPAVLREQWADRGGLGVSLGAVVEDADDGASVTAVSPGGPAAAAGIAIGDIIVAIDDVSLSTPEGSPSHVLIEKISSVPPGTVVPVELRADGETRIVTVTLSAGRPGLRVAELSEQYERLLARYDRLRDGIQRDGMWSQMELVPLTPQLGSYFGTDRGLLVVRAPGHPAARLEDGDVILAIGGREPNSPEHAMRILQTFAPGETIEMTLMRHMQRQTLSIAIDAGEQ